MKDELACICFDRKRFVDENLLELEVGFHPQAVWGLGASPRELCASSIVELHRCPVL